MRGHPYEQGFDLKLWPSRLGVPAGWKSPRMIFVNSMSDLFHERVPDEFITEVFRAMAGPPAYLSGPHETGRPHGRVARRRSRVLAPTERLAGGVASRIDATGYREFRSFSLSARRFDFSRSNLCSRISAPWIFAASTG